MVAHGVVSVARPALADGAAGLAQFALRLMQPIAPMLAQPADDIAAALHALGTAAIEWKVDGARVHVHKSGDDIRVFTRSRNDVTASAPEIVEALRAVDASELILDGEAIVLQRERRAAAVPADDAAVRPDARRRRRCERRCRCRCSSSTACGMAPMR